jgi:hypothetical protein
MYYHLDISWQFGFLLPFSIPICGHLVYLSRFGMLYQEKSGNHADKLQSPQGETYNFTWYIAIVG